jgi:hypothetical protein
MEPNYAAMAEQMWPGFLRLAAFACLVPVGVLVVLATLAEALRQSDFDAALRELGITARVTSADPAAPEAVEEVEAPAARPVVARRSA